jgi:hypothetical protein
MSIYSLRISCVALVAVAALLTADFAAAHHVLGRPAYSLNEDSNTPSAAQGESMIGDFLVTYMVYPAFPRPRERGRINLYLKDRRAKTSYEGKVTFRIRDNSLLSRLWGDSHAARLGSQAPDDQVFRQGFVFPENGEYMLSAEFIVAGQPLKFEFPLRVGKPMPVGYIVGFGLAALFAFAIIYRRRAMTGKIRSTRDRNS